MPGQLILLRRSEFLKAVDMKITILWNEPSVKVIHSEPVPD
jgi:hypothetical protein